MNKVILIGCLLLLSSCTRSPEPTLYVLNPLSQSTIKLERIKTAILIDDINTPDYLDKSPLLLFANPEMGKLDEQHQWAENPAHNIKQVLTQNLNTLLPKADIELSPAPSYFTPKRHLSITLNQLKMMQSGDVILSATYKYYQQDKCLIKRHVHYVKHVTELSWNAKVTALNDSLDLLSKDMALYLSKFP